MRIAFIFLMIFMLAGCQQLSPTDNKIRNCDNNILEAFQSENFESCIRICKECLSEFSSDLRLGHFYKGKKAICYSQWGIHLIRKGDTRGAIEKFERSTSIFRYLGSDFNENIINDYISLAMAYYYTGRYDQAVFHANNAMRTGATPDNKITALAIIARSYSAQGNVLQAQDNLMLLRQLGAGNVAQQIEKEIQGQAW